MGQGDHFNNESIKKQSGRLFQSKPDTVSIDIKSMGLIGHFTYEAIKNQS